MLGRKNIFKSSSALLLGLLCFILIVNSKNNSIEIKYQNVKNQVKIGEKENIVSKLKKTFNNEDIVAVLKIDGTSIDEIVVKASDNKYYLKRAVDKKEDKYGSIFIDYRNDMKDRKILMYGHNSTKSNPPFHDLEKYINKDFYEKYPYVEFTTEKSTEKYIIFSVMINEKGNYKHTVVNFKNDDEFKKHLSWMKNNSIYDTNVEVDISDEILTLQTCYYKPKDSYLIINAKKIKGEI